MKYVSKNDVKAKDFVSRGEGISATRRKPKGCECMGIGFQNENMPTILNIQTRFFTQNQQFWTGDTWLNLKKKIFSFQIYFRNN